ncbi:hypothetical protein L6R49_21925 [Myxococcota bacterium]|nr:hypothetical protein [Myxococcota bacterium]
MKTSPLHATYTAQGASLGDWGGGAVPRGFGPLQDEVDAARAGAIVVDLSPLGVLELEGSDTPRFCNSMFTNNIRDLAEGGGNHNALTDKQGRIFGMLDAYLIRRDLLLAVMDGSDVTEVSEYLDRYIIMDPIELRDRSEELAVLTIQGPRAEEILLAAGIPVPERIHTAWGGGLVARADRTGLRGFDLVISPEAFAEAHSKLTAAGARPAGTDALDALRVLRGLPRWPQDMPERAFIHELGIRERVCNFNKGCYIGQEIINRMDTMGKVNKRLTALVSEDAAPGAEVLRGDKAVGVITSVARVDGRVVSIGVLRKEAGEPGDGVEIRIGEALVPAVISPLPVPPSAHAAA